MVAGKKENEIVAESFLGEIQDPSHFGIHAFYVRQVSGPVLAGFLGIDKEAFFIAVAPQSLGVTFSGIVVHFLGPQFLKAGYYVSGAGKIYHQMDALNEEWSDYMDKGKLSGNGR